MSKWRKVKLGDYISQIRGVSYTPKDVSDALTERHAAILRANNIQDEGLNFRDLVYVDKSKIRKQQYLRKGDIVVCASSGSKNLVGKAAQVQDDMEISFGAFCKVVRTNKIYAPYLSNFFKSKNYRRIISDLSAGININNLRNENIDKLEIPLPPIETQKQIAKILDTAAELLAMRKQQHTELDDLIRSNFYDMFGDPLTNEKGWDFSSVDKVCSKIMGGGTPSKSNNEYYIGRIPWVTPKDMKTIWIIDSIDHISEDAIENSSAKLIPLNSVLMVIRSGILKRSLPVAVNKVNVAINQDMKAFITNEKVLTEYLLYFFMIMQNNILKNVRAVTADNIEFSLIKNMTIPCPPISLQTRFAEIVTKIEEQKALVKKAINKTQYLFDSLMNEYFE